MAIAENLAQIKARIAEAKKNSPDPKAPVQLVAVTKMHTIEELRTLADCGAQIFGENRVQELTEKYEQLDRPIQWHLIGHLQTNKVKYIIDKVCMIHSLESVSLAQEISKRMCQIGGKMDCLVQVNIADEKSKFGLKPDNTEAFIREVSQYEGIHIVGLMNIAPNYTDKEMLRPQFRQMYQMYCDLSSKKIPNVQMRYLSMGMSGDYDIAIEEGSNMVRIGSAIFR